MIENRCYRCRSMMKTLNQMHGKIEINWNKRENRQTNCFEKRNLPSANVFCGPEKNFPLSGVVFVSDNPTTSAYTHWWWSVSYVRTAAAAAAAVAAGDDDNARFLSPLRHSQESIRASHTSCVTFNPHCQPVQLTNLHRSLVYSCECYNLIG
ncbi:WD repeat-containing protein [Trichinella spiralis]|uniref:WD repeat-containing protein n=1 Tax=Trichinella spiralis TaxID=6334 RepID=A0ABR3L3L4_TRISP